MEAESALRRGNNNNNTAGGGENEGMNGGGANQSNKITVWDIRNETQELRDRATARKIGAKWIKGSRGAATDGKDAMEVLRYLEDDTTSLNTSANHYEDTSLHIASSSSEDSDGVLRGNARRSNRRRNKASNNNLGGDASPPPALVKVPRAAKRRGGGSHVDDDDGHDDKDTKSVVSSATVRLIRHMEREELEGDIDDFIVQNGPSGQMSLRRGGGATSPSAGGAKQRSLVSSLKAQQRPVNLTELMRLHISSRANEHPNGDTTVGQQGDEGQHWAPLGSSTTENDMLVVEGASSAAAFFSSSSSSSSDDPFSESTKEKRHHLSLSARRFGKFALRQNALLQGTEGAGDQNEQSLATSKSSSTPSSSSMSSLDFSPPLMNREELLGLRTDVGLSDRADISFLIGAEEAARGEECQGLSEDAVAELDAIKRRRALEEVEAAQRIEALQRQLFVDAHNERAVRVMKDAGAPIMEASQRPGDGKVSDAFIKKPRMGLRSRGGGGDGRLDPFGTNNRGGGGAIRPPGL
ncbi:Hypothetical protein, putative [Bodo saltans]|uniref:Uncharacterized protein n=1 Tax=Bodo saltans TaxID=75058 RepID=A0A0S4JXC3_BODSA|nr:Hypothetical protein, putative [Bodo saltans]|eukprot:CUG93800.1 Hypothetical protein, putative [Bodo saltans]